MQIRLYNSSNNNHIALRFAEVTSRQLVMPFMLSKPVTQLRMQIIQKIGSVETILAQEYYRHTGFRLTNVVLDGSTLKIYANGSILRTVTVTPVTVNRLELTGGAKKLLVDEMFVAPNVATSDDVETWYNLDRQFLDPDPVITDDRIPSAESWSKKNRTYYQDTPPTGTHSLGDVWFDTSDHNRRHWWDGSKWVDAEDVSPIDASRRPVTARGLGGDIEMDKDGMRFIRKADNEVTLQMDIETGSAFFKGDITGASGTFSGELAAKSIKAEWFEEIRNVLPYTGQDSLDADKPIVIPFYIPSETTKIVAAFLSAEARRYRAYSKSAPYNAGAWWNKRTGNVATFGETPVTVALQTTSASGTTGNQTLRHRHYEPGSSINIMTGNVKDEEFGMTDLGHNHSFNYTRASGVQLNNFNDHKHELDPSHAHDLEFGIHEDTTPASVRMRVHNGTSWSSYITLASAPSGNVAYDLISGASVPKHNNNASEMDLTSYLSGTGWKHIEFSSSRLGLIAWNIILKLDITA